MAHTLNEIKRSYAASTLADMFDIIAQLTGWTHDSQNHRMYLGTTGKLFWSYDSNITPCFISDISGQPVAVGNAQGFPVSAFTVWFHKSTNENVAYIAIDNHADSDQPFFQHIIAKNADGDEVLLRFNTYDYLYIGTKTLSEADIFYLRNNTIKPTLHNAVTKLPDIWDGVEFPELYAVVNVKSQQLENQLVRFDNGQIMRIVGVYYTQAGLAFPVSEGS